MTKEEEKYLFWLTSLSGLGLPFVQRFFERYKSIDKARSLSETDIKKAEWMKPREKNYFAKAYKQEGWQHESYIILFLFSCILSGAIKTH